LGFKDSWYAPHTTKAEVRTVWLSAKADQWKMLEFDRGDIIMTDAYQGIALFIAAPFADKNFLQHIAFTTKGNPMNDDLHGYLLYSKPHHNKRRQEIRTRLDAGLKETNALEWILSYMTSKYTVHQFEIK